MEPPEITIRDEGGLRLVVSTNVDDPAFRVLLVDAQADDGEVHMSEIGIAGRNVEKLKKQATRSVMQYRSNDGALSIHGREGRWTLRLAVPEQPVVEVALDEEETRALQAALFEPLG